MHHSCEIIMPPCEDIEKAIEAILAPFSENADDDDRVGNGFWDWYVIGGRFAGKKTQAKLGPERIQAFYDWLNQEKITVSSFQAGKQSLQPVSQIPKVDAKWNEMFPEAAGPCPLFAHSNDQYGKGTKSAMPGDICLLSEVPDGLKTSRVIIASPGFNPATNDFTGPPKASFMLSQDIWNGVNHEDTSWDGTVLEAVRRRIAKIENYAEGYKAVATPQPDWISVTVDYHS